MRKLQLGFIFTSSPHSNYEWNYHKYINHIVIPKFGLWKHCNDYICSHRPTYPHMGATTLFNLVMLQFHSAAADYWCSWNYDVTTTVYTMHAYIIAHYKSIVCIRSRTNDIFSYILTSLNTSGTHINHSVGPFEPGEKPVHKRHFRLPNLYII